MFRHAVADLTRTFRLDAVNLLMAHTHLEGALFGDSERRVHLGEEWAATPQSLPSTAHYVALGHIHKPQRVEAAPVPAYYAGSPLQLDFGEAGENKSCVVVDAKPGRPAKVEAIPYQGGRPLADLCLTLQQIEQDRERLCQAGWLRITLAEQDPAPDLARQIRQLVPNALAVHVPQAEALRGATIQLTPQASPVDLYRAYHERTHGKAASTAVLEAFAELYEQAGGAHAAS
jgi:exonuclease SbcD